MLAWNMEQLHFINKYDNGKKVSKWCQSDVKSLRTENVQGIVRKVIAFKPLNSAFWENGDKSIYRIRIKIVTSLTLNQNESIIIEKQSFYDNLGIVAGLERIFHETKT